MNVASTVPEMERAANRGGCSPETSLWLAVIEHVISTEQVECARDWLRSKDGRLVAAMAGIDPDWLSARVLPATGRLHARRQYAGRRLAS